MTNYELRSNASVISSQDSDILRSQDSKSKFNILGSLKINSIIDCQDFIHCCKFHPSGEIFAVGLSDGTIKIFKKDDSKLIYSLADNDSRLAKLPVTCVRFLNPPNDLNQDHYKILVATYVAGFVKIWHYPTKSCLYTIYDKQIEPLTIDFNKAHDRMAVGGYDEKIKIYDLHTKALVNTLENNDTSNSNSGHSSRVYCVKYHMGESNMLLSGGWDNTVQIWDDRVANSQSFIYGPHICGDSLDIDVFHNHLLTGSWRKSSTLQIWDLRNNDLVRDVFKNKSNMMIYGCQWLSKSYILSYGCDNNSAIIYDRGTLKPIGGLVDLNGAVTSADNDQKGDFPSIIVCSSNLVYSIKPMRMF